MLELFHLEPDFVLVDQIHIWFFVVDELVVLNTLFVNLDIIGVVVKLLLRKLRQLLLDLLDQLFGDRGLRV